MLLQGYTHKTREYEIRAAVYDYIQFCKRKGYINDIDLFFLYIFIELSNSENTNITFFLQESGRTRLYDEGRLESGSARYIDMRDTINKLQEHKDEFDWSGIKGYV